MNIVQSVTSVLSKYATFSGRATRSEFWYWNLFSLIVTLLTMAVDAFVFNAPMSDPNIFHPAHTIFALIVFIPALAVTVRRLHDTNHSGWWLLICITIIGLLYPLLYWYCLQGTEGSNLYGPPSQ